MQIKLNLASEIACVTPARNLATARETSVVAPSRRPESFAPSRLCLSVTLTADAVRTAQPSPAQPSPSKQPIHAPQT